MKRIAVFKKFLAFFIGVSLMLSSYVMPFFSENVFAGSDSEQNQTQTVQSINDVTNIRWVEGSSATVAWEAAENANYYSVTVNVYQPDSTTIIGAVETGTTSTELDVQQEIYSIVGDNIQDNTYVYDYVIVSVFVVAQIKQEDSVVGQSNGVVSDLHEYRLLSKNQIPTPYNLTLSNDLKLSFKCDLDNPEDVSRVCMMHCILTDANGVDHECGEYLEVVWQSQTGTVDVSKTLINTCAYSSLTGKFQVSCYFQLLPWIDQYSNVSDISEKYYVSKISEISNTVLFESPYVQLPTPSNLVLGNDLKLSFDCNLGDYSDAAVESIECIIDYEGFCISYGNNISITFENGKWVADLTNSVAGICRTFPVTGAVNITCKSKLIASNSKYIGSYSQNSNTIRHIPQFKQYKAPTDLSLSKDYVLSFKCDEYNTEGEDMFLCSLNMFTLDGREVMGSGNNYQISIVDGVGQIDLSNDARNMIASFLPVAGGQISIKLKHLSNSEEYATSEYSSPSNSIVTSIPVESIKLSPSAPIVCLGNSYYLGKTITPVNAHYEKIEWSSDNTGIVTVDDKGLIKGIAPGTANITAKIGDVSSTVTITVYTISSNVKDSSENAEVIGTAGNIIDDIANNDNPDISNTDIDSADIDDIKDKIQDGINNGDSFHTDIVAIKKYYDSYKTNWGQIQKATRELNAQFEGAYNIEVEMYHKDKDGNQTHIGNITELDNEITFTFDLPTGMKEQQSGDTKKYILVRVHKNTDGTLEYSPVDYTLNGDGTFSTSSNLFSDFIWCSVEKEPAPEYRCDVGESLNGTVVVSKNTAKAGETITVTATPDPCYELDAIKVNENDLSGNTFTMPAENVTVIAEFKAKAHQLTPVIEKPATCEEDGYEAYYKCTVCNKLFSDAEGKNEISAPKVIKKLEHSWDEGEVTKDPACEEEGVKTFHCTRDGCKATKTEPINPLGHNELIEVAEKAPTKTEPGNIKHYKCERCGKLFSDAKGKDAITKEQTVIPATGHDLTEVKAKAATCTEPGNTAYYICKDDDCKCGKAYSDPYGQHEINIEDTIKSILGHDPNEVAGKDPTCTEDGYEKYYKCSRCHMLFSDADGINEIEKPVVITKLGHDMKHIDAKKPTHEDDGNYEYYHCDRCGKNFDDEEGKKEITDAEIVNPHIGAAVLGEEISDGVFKYKVTNPRTDGSGTVTIIGVENKNKSVVIPATVELKLDTYKINRIGPKAFYNDKTIESLSIGPNVVIIDSSAFYGCSYLVKVYGGKALKTVSSSAFAYCTRLKSFSIVSPVLNKIGSKAFYKDKNLKTIYIKKTTKLTKAGVKKSLKGSSVKTVKVKKSKVKKYKKYFKKSNSGRKVKVKK